MGEAIIAISPSQLGMHIYLYKFNMAITTPAREASALAMPINSAVVIFLFSSLDGTITSAPGLTSGELLKNPVHVFLSCQHY